MSSEYLIGNYCFRSEWRVGPWVEKVEARVGVDTDNDEKIDQWTDWQEVKETYR
jgi:hypothetical protein